MTSNLVFKTKGKSKSFIADAIVDKRQYEHSSNLIGYNEVNLVRRWAQNENFQVVIKINRFFKPSIFSMD